jgi:hypothetical protein
VAQIVGKGAELSQPPGRAQRGRLNGYRKSLRTGLLIRRSGQVHLGCPWTSAHSVAEVIRFIAGRCYHGRVAVTVAIKASGLSGRPVPPAQPRRTAQSVHRNTRPTVGCRHRCHVLSHAPADSSRAELVVRHHSGRCPRWPTATFCDVRSDTLATSSGVSRAAGHG